MFRRLPDSARTAKALPGAAAEPRRTSFGLIRSLQPSRVMGILPFVMLAVQSPAVVIRELRCKFMEQARLEDTGFYFPLMQKRFFSVRINQRPCEMAMDACAFSPSGFFASTLNSGPASMTVVSPLSPRK